MTTQAALTARAIRYDRRNDGGYIGMYACAVADELARDAADSCAPADHKGRRGREPFVVYTDSRHIADAVNGGWLPRWRANDWRGSGRAPLKNVDFWQNVDWALGDIGEVRHIERDSDCAEMARAEELAVGAAGGELLLIDAQYEGESGAAGRRAGGLRVCPRLTRMRRRARFRRRSGAGAGKPPRGKGLRRNGRKRE